MRPPTICVNERRHCPRRYRPFAHHCRVAGPLQHCGAALYLLSHGRPFHLGIWQQRSCAGAARAFADGGFCYQHGFIAAAIAVRAHSVLCVAVLLLRLQQNHHQAPRVGGRLSATAATRAASVPPPSNPQPRPGRTPYRFAAAFGGWLAHFFVGR